MAADAMGDAEGRRHLNQVLAFRLDAAGDKSRASIYEEEAKKIENLIGKANGARKRRQ